MQRIVLENLRSFEGKHTVALKPLNLLVGENSSGKSTFLAAASSLLTSSLIPTPKGLNTPPYELGSFNAIATYRGGKAGRKKFFGFGVSIGDDNGPCQGFHVQYHSIHGRAVIKHYELTATAGKILIDFTPSGFSGRLSDIPSLPDLVVEFNATLEVEDLELSNLTSSIVQAMTEKQPEALSKIDISTLFGLLIKMHGQFQELGCSIAPIRSKPQRNYDSTIDQYETEGKHVPYLVAKLLLDNAQSAPSKHLREALKEFGAESGLYSDLRAARSGSKDTGPFQIQVTLEGPPRNLTDVGYGVSQSLPIIAQLANLKAEKYIFIQQPEVHLHPKAQSALGSFFAALAAKKDRYYLVETHSDYLIDRVRQEVAAGVIPSTDVQILYFEVVKQKTQIFNISLDKLGNLTEAPPNYRSFFLQERKRLLNRDHQNVPDS